MVLTYISEHVALPPSSAPPLDSAGWVGLLKWAGAPWGWGESRKTPVHQGQASSLPGCRGVPRVAVFFTGCAQSRLCQGWEGKQGVGGCLLRSWQTRGKQ